jgi:Arc/MetJ-type ribon-helix-helix transcriptional regulator
MELDTLQQHVRSLATLDESESLILSCYLPVGDIPDELVPAYQDRKEEILMMVNSAQREELRASFKQIEDFFYNEMKPATLGMAFFVRQGSAPMFTALEFHINVPLSISIDPLPQIYHLVELKDNYHRYLLVIANTRSLRLFEVNLGAVTWELWQKQPDLRKRVGREWTKLHYQNHRREKDRQYFKEAIRIMEQRMFAGGYKHLILAGSQSVISPLQNQLPEHLQDILVSTVNTGHHESLDEVLQATLTNFIEEEERESQSLADAMADELARGGLALAGVKATENALHMGQVDTLLLLQTVDTEQREELVRLAEASSAKVEIVSEHSKLDNLGGVGCLLRYHIPEILQKKQLSRKSA